MKADHIVNVVLGNMDKNKDGKLSPEEFEAAGLNALPMFEGLGAEGHHYDVESGTFLCMCAVMLMRVEIGLPDRVLLTSRGYMRFNSYICSIRT